MKSFFEEYGFVMLAAIVVITLITMASPIGAKVQTGLESTITSFSTNVNTELSEAFS